MLYKQTYYHFNNYLFAYQMRDVSSISHKFLKINCFTVFYTLYIKNILWKIIVLAKKYIYNKK